jgi:hypothetical protein
MSMRHVEVKEDGRTKALEDCEPGRAHQVEYTKVEAQYTRKLAWHSYKIEIGKDGILEW